MSLVQKHLRTAVVSLGIVLGATGAANAFNSASGYATTGLNLRAGPGVGYPAVAVIGAGDAVLVYGCTAGYGWCDISWSGNRGWASGRYLQMDYQSRREPILTQGAMLGIPFVLFSLDTYWQQNYQSRAFYGSRGRYQSQGFDAQNRSNFGAQGNQQRPQPKTTMTVHQQGSAANRGVQAQHPVQGSQPQNHTRNTPAVTQRKPVIRKPVVQKCKPGTHASGNACVGN